jgi:3-oxoacyl-[acyl-carrier protein] reductase
VTLVRGYHAVNNINPGPVDTDLNPATSAFAKILLDKVMALPRYVTGDEITSLVAYLASPEAAFMTGASLSIDGGFTA